MKQSEIDLWTGDAGFGQGCQRAPGFDGDGVLRTICRAGETWFREKFEEWREHIVLSICPGLRQCRPLSYQQSEEVVPGVRLTFHDAGHILGSAIVQLDVNDLGRTRRLVFSGDLGNDCTPLMRSPAVLEQADVLLMESTYGDRDHRCSDDTLEEFLGVLQQAQMRGNARLAKPRDFLQLGDREFVAFQQRNDAQPRRIGQGFEDVILERGHRRSITRWLLIYR